MVVDSLIIFENMNQNITMQKLSIVLNSKTMFLFGNIEIAALDPRRFATCKTNQGLSVPD